MSHKFPAVPKIEGVNDEIVLSDQECEKAIAEIYAEEERKLKELREKSSTPEELTYKITCLVEEVEGETKEVRHYDTHNAVIGGRIDSTSGGNVSFLEMKVTTDDAPVKTVLIRGLPHIEAGNRINAYIVKGEYLHEDQVDDWHESADWRDESPKHLIEREWKEKENAIKIEKLDEHGKVLATFKDTSYEIVP